MRCAVARKAAEEAASVAFVADARADGIDSDEQGIGVAIDTDVANFEYMSAGLTFFPEAIARAREEHDFVAALRLSEGNVVHEAEHEDVAVRGVLNNGRDQAVGLREVQLHESSL